jgi:hypothetical protein
MTIRPLHSDMNLEVFYVNICGFILQYALCDYMIEDSKRAVELHREHMLCSLHALYTHFKTDLTFEVLILKTNFALTRDLVTHGCAETPLLLLLVSKWTSFEFPVLTKIYTRKLGLQTAF